MGLKITREQLEKAAGEALRRLIYARKRYDLARHELDEAIENAAVARERLQFSESVRQVGGETKGSKNAE